jgi:glycerol-3-phosphate dehydrogenase
LAASLPVQERENLLGTSWAGFWLWLLVDPRRIVMPDNTQKTNNRDRKKVAGGEDYEVQYLAKETGVSPEQARELIKAYGNDRRTLLNAARSLPGRDPHVRSSRV